MSTPLRSRHDGSNRGSAEAEGLTPPHSVEAEQSVPAFIAAAAALQAIAASSAAARHAAAEADGEVARNREHLGTSARRRMGAEELQERYVSGERTRAAAHAQRDLDEVAARVHRDRVGGVQ